MLILPVIIIINILTISLSEVTELYTQHMIPTFHDLTFALISQLGPIRNPIPHLKNSPNSEIA